MTPDALGLDIPSRTSVTGVILAGGRSRRMGGADKGLILFDGRPLIEWVIEAMGIQVDRLLIGANRNGEAYARFGFPVIADRLSGFQGPLAGIHSAMIAATTDWILTLPCDNPHPPKDLLTRLCTALAERPVGGLAVAHDGERMQPLYALLPVSLSGDLHAFLAGGERKAECWYARHDALLVDFSATPERFANINSPEDSARLSRRSHTLDEGSNDQSSRPE